MDLDPYSHALHDDPYPVYEELREKYPVHYNPTHDFWHVAGYDDVLEAIHQPQIFSSGRGISLEIRGDGEQSPMPMMIVMDPPSHGELRALVNRGFTPRRINELEARIREIATQHIDQFIGSGQCDLWQDFAAPLPTTVIAELLGVPVADREWFKDRSTRIVANAGGERAAKGDNPALELGTYLAAQFEEKRKQPCDDLMTDLLEAKIDGQSLSVPALVGFAVLLLIAGN
ncbi:MAG: hypothetical protein V3T64_12645 [Myxococcota bacterium]